MVILDMDNTKMKHKILINEKISDEAIKYFLSNGIEVKKGFGFSDEQLIEELKDCDAFLVRTTEISNNVIDNCPNLKVIAKHGTGLDGVDVEYANSKGIKVISAPGLNANSVAEHTISLILACAKHLKETTYEYSKGNYSIKDSVVISEISNKTLGLIGYGNIAQRVAKMTHFGFDMNIIVYDPYINKSCISNYVNVVDDVNELLSSSDFVSIHIPANNKNEKFINKDKLSKMKRSAFLINTSRGNIVDENELINAVENGVIAGAGLDVCLNEKANKDSKLFSLSNIILTPHIGGASKEALDNVGLNLANQIVNILKK